jgi:hypothetical protein
MTEWARHRGHTQAPFKAGTAGECFYALIPFEYEFHYIDLVHTHKSIESL